MPEPETSSRCKYKYELTDWQCQRVALLESADGFCICHEPRDDKNKKLFDKEIFEITQKSKNEDCHFEGFYFPYEIDFYKIKIKKSVFFEGAIFKDNVNFNRAQFSGEETSFLNSKFLGRATSFTAAQFSGKLTSFYAAHFSGKNVHFGGAVFSADITNFRAAVFSGDLISFVRAQFFKDVDYSWASVGKHLDFIFTRFLGCETIIRNLSLGDSAFLIFNRTLFEEKNRNDLRNLDLSKCLFRETNLEYCDVSLIPMNWKWQLLNDSMSNEAYQEIIDDVPHVRFYHAADSYRRLKVNFIKRQDYGKAAICNYREWECNRKSSKFSLYKNWTDYKATVFKRTILRWANFKSAFLTLLHLIRGSFNLLFIGGLKLSCGYGEKLQNVLLTIIFWLAAFPFLFTSPCFRLCSVDIPSDKIPDISVWQGLSFGEHLVGGIKFTLYNFFPLYRQADLKPCTDPGIIVTVFIAITGWFMIGMFVYVFRRRLMR